ncbi:MAG: YbhB/YbcL family Raf kinase inhibitor-like protein [Phycisphaerae bacterium]
MIGLAWNVIGTPVIVIAAIAMLGLVGCNRAADSSPAASVKISLTSSAFANGATIPKEYTADGQNISPALAWSGVPAGTKELALIMDDPDAPVGTWDHWLLFGIPATAVELKAGQSAYRKGTSPSGMLEGRNSWGNNGYEGPEPPPGKPHRYIFRLYALDAPLKLSAGADKKALLKAMDGHILAQGELIGKYGR